MYKKGLRLIPAVILICSLLLTGCGKPSLPSIRIDGSTLEGSVEYVNGRTCLLRVTVEDGHYDKDDLVYLTFMNTSAGNETVSVGDRVTFSYHYTTDVSEYNGEPHITVNEVSVGKIPSAG